MSALSYMEEGVSRARPSLEIKADLSHCSVEAGGDSDDIVIRQTTCDDR